MPLNRGVGGAWEEGGALGSCAQKEINAGIAWARCLGLQGLFSELKAEKKGTTDERTPPLLRERGCGKELVQKQRKQTGTLLPGKECVSPWPAAPTVFICTILFNQGGATPAMRGSSERNRQEV